VDGTWVKANNNNGGADVSSLELPVNVGSGSTLQNLTLPQQSLTAMSFGTENSVDANGIALGASCNTAHSVVVGLSSEGVVGSSTVIGIGSQGLGSYSTVLGISSSASELGVAIGRQAYAGERSVAIGSGAAASGLLQSIAIGDGATALSRFSCALGANSSVAADCTMSLAALGAQVQAPGVISIGPNTVVSAQSSRSVQFGFEIDTAADCHDFIGIGSDMNLANVCSRTIMIGSDLNITTEGIFNSCMIGWSNVLQGPLSVAIGRTCSANTLSVAIGNFAKALGSSSVAIGDRCTATGESVAIGVIAKTTGSDSVAIGK